jgi:DNA-binding MarR family transcriptional regulator
MSQTPALPSFLATSLGFLLAKLSQRLVRQAEDDLSGLGLQTKQVGVLTMIADSGPKSQKEIGDRLEIDRTTMVSLVDGLERDELVARKPDPFDRRAFLVTLTPKGKRALGKAHEIVIATEQKFLLKLGDGERKQLLTLLTTLFKGDDR